ncbi:glycosyltransferase [Parabacteroides distasonis]|uniref:glycosyltransferase n=1 Tax=Parabacteroides distasonis TaxID=823 RepID=UPI0021649A85|nr:glycosyltransferase [Parabacteroides distasonis]UVR23370.1 glycosyltransferase [Parabacteroides distasonis]
MKKILHLSKYFTPYVAGIEDVCLSVIQAIKGDCEQKVLCFNHEKGNISLKVSGVEVIRADTFGEFARQPISIAYFFLLKKYIQTFQPDIIHLHVPNPLICAYVMFVIPRRIELVVHWHSDIVVQPFIYTFLNRLRNGF